MGISPAHTDDAAQDGANARLQQAMAGRLGGLTSWARDRERMLRIAADGNQALLSRLGNRSAISLHFTRLAERRWRLVKGDDYGW
jgi:hypothetical protein